MAETKYYEGIPDIPADTTSTMTNAPYDLDPDAKYDTPKYLTDDELMRRTLIDGSWKIQQGPLRGDIPKIAEAGWSFRTAAIDEPLKVAAELTNIAATEPEKAVIGTAIGAKTISTVTPLIRNALGKFGTTKIGGAVSALAAGVPAGIATGGALMALEPTPAGNTWDTVTGPESPLWGAYLQQEVLPNLQKKVMAAQKQLKKGELQQAEFDSLQAEYETKTKELTEWQQQQRKARVENKYESLENAQKVLNKAKEDLAAGKISQKDFDDKQKFFDMTVAENIEYAKQLDGFNEAVNMLEGAAYPTQDFATNVIAYTADFVQDRDYLRAIEREQKGIDPENLLNKLSTSTGALIPVLASSAFGGRYSRLGRKQFFKAMINDPEYKALRFVPVKSAKEAGATAEKIGKVGVYLQELADYDWEEKQKYIEETGDKELVNYKPDTNPMKYAYAATSAQLEFGGGISPLFVGAVRKVLGRGTLKAAGITGSEEFLEELFQSWDKFLSQKVSGTTDKTWGQQATDGMKDALLGGVLGTGFGAAIHAHGKAQVVKSLTEFGFKPDIANKIADNMIDQASEMDNPQLFTVRDNIRSKVAAMYEDADMTPAEKEDAIEAQTDLELGWLVAEAAENGYKPEESPLLQGVVNKIGYFRTGIPEQIAAEVERLNNEIANLRSQLREEQAKETKNFDKIDQLESKIEQFFAKLPESVAKLVETDRQKVQEMLAEQSNQLRAKQTRRKLVRDIQERATKAIQKSEESDVQQSLRRLQQETKAEEMKAREAETAQRAEQRKLRKAIEKLRQKLFVSRARAQGVYDLDSDVALELLHKAGLTDKQIVDMAPRDLEDLLWNAFVKPTKTDKDFVKEKAQNVIDALKGQDIDSYAKNDASDDASVYLVVGADVFRLGLTRTGKNHKTAYTANINANAPVAEIVELIKQNRGKTKKRAHELLGFELLSQSKGRGFYIPEYRFIGRSQKMDASTLSHELAHDWILQYFRHYRSGNASEAFMKSWGAVEKALGIAPDALTLPDKASEAFARAYEAWIQNKTDWAKNISVEDDDRNKMIKTFEQYREYLTDIYGDLTNPYFKEAWGEVGELKPELKAWFDIVTLGGDTIDAQVKMGAITQEEAEVKKTAQTINNIVEKSGDKLTTQEKAEINAVQRINDTKRYEVKGGNKNALQNRLSSMAQDMDANNVVLGRYDTRRDMLEVARQADEFVRNRMDEALDIINGIRPETEGLYASDLYTALERVAMETNNVDLAMELVNSKVATELAKELGQRVAGFRDFKGNGEMDAVSQLKALNQKFQKDYEKNGKDKVERAGVEFEQELTKADSEQDVDSFLKSIECQ